MNTKERFKREYIHKLTKPIDEELLERASDLLQNRSVIIEHCNSYSDFDIKLIKEKYNDCDIDFKELSIIFKLK